MGLIIYSFLKWINNFIPHFRIVVINYPCWGHERSTGVCFSFWTFYSVTISSYPSTTPHHLPPPLHKPEAKVVVIRLKTSEFSCFQYFLRLTGNTLTYRAQAEFPCTNALNGDFWTLWTTLNFVSKRDNTVNFPGAQMCSRCNRLTSRADRSYTDV